MFGRILSLVLIFCFASIGNAETFVSGSVSGVWAPAGSPYVASDSIWVAEGDALFIQAGVEVQFATSSALLVYGGFHAAGAVDDSIRFIPQAEGVAWCGIRFLGADDGCTLRYCSIRGSEVEGTTRQTSSGGGIYSEDSSPLITHCTIQDCRADFYGVGSVDCGGGIACYGGSPEIRANRILDCGGSVFCTDGGGGISVRDADAVIEENEIRRCFVHGFAGGISVRASTARIAHNVIEGCGGFHYAGGIGIKDESTVEVFDNLIIGNECPDMIGGGIYIVSSQVVISFCTIAGNSCGDEFLLGQGGGLSVSASPGDVEVHNCIFWGNHALEGDQIDPPNLTGVHHCDVQDGHPGDGNFDINPAFVTTEGGELDPGYFLSSIDAGQPADSPCIDASDRTSIDAGLSERTTRTDLIPDNGVADLGFHHRVGPTAGLANLVPRSSIRLVGFPNPFRDQTTILLTGGSPAFGELSIYDVSGRLVRSFRRPGGDTRSIDWDGRTADGDRLAPGVYLMRFQSPRDPERTGGKVILVP